MYIHTLTICSNIMTKMNYVFLFVTTLFFTEVSWAQSAPNDVQLSHDIDSLVLESIDLINNKSWQSAYENINKSVVLFSQLDNDSIYDDSEILALKSKIWNNEGLPNGFKFDQIYAVGELYRDSANFYIHSRNKVIEGQNLSESPEDDKITAAYDTKISKNWNLAYVNYSEASKYSDNEDCLEKKNEAWRNMIFDDKIESYMSPLTNSIENIIFFTITVRSEIKCPFVSISPSNTNVQEVVNNSCVGQAPIRVPFVLIWLLFGALFFTFYFKFISIRGFKHALDVVRGKFDNPNKNEKGEVSHFQALTAALSGTVGVGNIAGVAIAVSIGGPGATFWMIVAGLLGMSAKFIECTLGTKYRMENADGSVSGGPAYYLSRGLAKKGKRFGQLGKVLAIMFSIACIGGSLGGGNMVQINQATKQLIHATGGVDSFFHGQSWIFGTLMAVLVGVIIIGGIKSIAKVTDKVVPLMVGVYVLSALVVLGVNFLQIPNAFGQIFNGAFNSGAMYGGIIGVMIQGFKRAAFSNEAGIGSASIAHSAAKTEEPVSEGMVSLLEPFIDTVVICTMTALVIVISGYGGDGAALAHSLADSGELKAIELTSAAFSQTISWFPIVLSVSVILFALSTMLSWSYYGLKSWTYIFGESKVADISYKVLFCAFVIIGSAISAKSVFGFGDAMIFAMCFPNVLGLFLLAPEVKSDLKDYLKRVKSGEIVQYKK
jgi:AGCS family alanine or glycine:cation symporter